MSIILTNIWVNALVLVMKIELRNIFSLRSTRSMRLNLTGLEGGSGLSLLGGAPGPGEVIYSICPTKKQSWMDCPNLTYKLGLGREH